MYIKHDTELTEAKTVCPRKAWANYTSKTVVYISFNSWAANIGQASTHRKPYSLIRK